jgi:hypothetical protein
MTTYSLDAFDQYKHLENRLTRALGVALERSPPIQAGDVVPITLRVRTPAGRDD